MSCEITDQYLDKLYDDISREESRLLTSLRTSHDMELDDREVQRQVQLLHIIASTALKLKLHRRKQAMKFV